MNFVFLMDPLDLVIMEKDTSFILMLGAYRKGHSVYYLPNSGLFHKSGQAYFRCAPVIPQQHKDKPFIEKDEVILTEDNVDAVFIRSDPPFDYEYLMSTWLLDRLPTSIPVINSPSGIRTTNEKIWATQFKSIIPPTLITRRKDELLQFLKEENEIIIKPTDGFGGQSVFRITSDDNNTNALFETLTDNEQRDIIVQKFIPESQNGDKRILLLDGEPLGAVLRVHSENDHRNNFFSGGSANATEITDHDKEIIALLKPKLKELGLHFVGIDILGDYLIEVNVTSPTCLQEMNALYNQTLENKVVEFVEKLVEERKAADRI